MSHTIEQPAAADELTLNVIGMGCEGCVKTVSDALASVNGVEDANVNLNTEKAIVRYNPAVVDAEDIVAAVKAAGYAVRKV